MNIKRNNKVRIFVIIYILLLFLGFYQIVKAETEVIKNFDVNITIQKDGSLLITEKIIYDFGTNQRHGIFRSIPLKSVNGPQLYIKVLEVKDESGKLYQYITSITNNILKIKIGDLNSFITGSKTYIITYQVYNAIRTFEDHDELYWNVTGNEWSVAIQNANASITLPDSSIYNVRMDCFTGPYGSTQKNCTFNQSDSNVNYSITQSLNINEGLTIVLGIPLGYIHKTYISSPQDSFTAPKLNTASIISVFNFFISFLLFIVFLIGIINLIKRRTWRFKPEPIIPKELKGEPITVEYNPPDNLSPIDIGTILDRRIDVTDISPVIIDLAVRGYLKIRYMVQEIPFWPDKKDFELIKLKDGTDLVHPADKIMFELLFNGRDNVKLSDLREQKDTFRSAIQKIEEDTEQYLHDEGYFDQAANEKSKKLETYFDILYMTLIIVYIIYKNYPSEFLSISFALFLGATVVLNVIMLKLSYKLTPKGISTLRKILGFREFLQLTEKDKLQLLNAPELQPEMFERFLPYAMVLGVEDKWSEKFKDIYSTIPNWYEGAEVASLNSYTLVHNLILFDNSFNRVFDIAFQRKSKGFGGGGSSGGGSGGGGGGSW